MRGMEANFSFFKAGQGSFYGGQILLRETNRLYTIVYDCGTSPFIKGNSKSLNDEIDYFRHARRYFPHSNKVIELLFISHLDYDHVSGLKKLLRMFKVKNIILPYIDKKYRHFYLASVFDGDDPDNNLTIEDYILFIESPNQFISKNSEETKMYFVKSDKKNEVIEYVENNDNDDNNESGNVYVRGTLNEDTEELIGQQNVLVYENNLQFFIKRDWEFTTYAKSVSEDAIEKLHACLKKKLRKKATESLTLEDLKKLTTEERKKAHRCYTDCIGEINSHGLVLLHGPIGFEYLNSSVYSSCELHNFHGDYRRLYDEHYFNNDNRAMVGTLLLGDTSINPANNPIDFPLAFKDKLANVQIVQVPHHGSSKNWDLAAFEALDIGANFKRWEYKVVSVCNFGYGNRYGHPSHEVLSDLRATLFLNTQFSRLNIKYNIEYNV